MGDLHPLTLLASSSRHPNQRSPQKVDYPQHQQSYHADCLSYDPPSPTHYGQPRRSRRPPPGMGTISMFLPILIGFSAGCMIWTLMRIIPSLPLSAARQKVIVIDPSLGDQRPTDALDNSVDPFNAETKETLKVPPSPAVMVIQKPFSGTALPISCYLDVARA